MAETITLPPSYLLVEGYEPLALALRSALRKFAPQHLAYSVSNLREARAKLSDLIILDFDPPFPGTIAYLQELRAARPATRVLVLASEIPRELLEARAGLGGLHFVEKPFELSGFGAALQPLLRSGNLRGSLHDLSLADVAMLACLGGLSAVLAVRNEAGDRGDLAVKNGRILHATTAQNTGPAALEEMLLWHGADFIEQPFIASVTRSFPANSSAALVAALRAMTDVKLREAVENRKTPEAAIEVTPTEGPTESALESVPPPGPSELETPPIPSANEILLDLPLDVVAMQFTASFQIGSIRARPAAPTVAIQIPALAARASLPLETGFQLGDVDLDPAGQLVLIRLLPTTQPFHPVRTNGAFEVNGATVVPANEHERLQLMSAANSTLTMQLFAPLELVALDLSAFLEVRQLVLRCRSNAVRVTLNSANAEVRNGAIFKTASIALDEAHCIRELTLTPASD